MAAERAGLAGASERPPPDPAPNSWDSTPRAATYTPGTGAGSARTARDFTFATLRRWGMAERGEDIAIVVSELLANALRHAVPGSVDPRPPIRLGLIQCGPCVMCAVADPGRAAPVLRVPGALAETGRGLHIIRALSDRWGYTAPGDAGKVVWAVFTSPLTPPASNGAGTAGWAGK
jgi:anti-sigma regulatory factor (Ser/Thr protein kinase)